MTPACRMLRPRMAAGFASFGHEKKASAPILADFSVRSSGERSLGIRGRSKATAEATLDQGERKDTPAASTSRAGRWRFQVLADALGVDCPAFVGPAAPR
jgi:hypothetical protein